MTPIFVKSISFCRNAKYTLVIADNDLLTSKTINAKIVGCKDPNAGNYNPDADIHDQTMCIYVEPDPDPKPIDTPTNPIQTPVIEPVNSGGGGERGWARGGSE